MGGRVVNLKATPHEPYDVYIGHQRGPKMWRGGYYLPRSPWRNPFNKDFRNGLITREEAIELYERYLLGERPDLMARLPELRGKTLACWCAPEPCHGDGLLRLAASTGGG